MGSVGIALNGKKQPVKRLAIRLSYSEISSKSQLFQPSPVVQAYEERRRDFIDMTSQGRTISHAIPRGSARVRRHEHHADQEGR